MRLNVPLSSRMKTKQNKKKNVAERWENSGLLMDRDWLSSEDDGVPLPGRQQCIFAHNHQLQNREASLIVFAMCYPVKRFIYLFIYFCTGYVALELSDRCSSTGYLITAVYSTAESVWLSIH